jgi:hypothetical protein
MGVDIGVSRCRTSSDAGWPFRPDIIKAVCRPEMDTTVDPCGECHAPARAVAGCACTNNAPRGRVSCRGGGEGSS